MKKVFIIILVLASKIRFAQSNSNAYTDSIKAYQKNYCNTHEVVKGEDHKYLNFFAPDRTYRYLLLLKK